MPPDDVTARAEPAVTAAVVVKDRAQLMRACLDALAAQDHDNFDVLVVDNGSTDGTLQMLLRRRESFPVPLTVIEVPGPAGAREAARRRTCERRHHRLHRFRLRARTIAGCASSLPELHYRITTRRRCARPYESLP